MRTKYAAIYTGRMTIQTERRTLPSLEQNLNYAYQLSGLDADARRICICDPLFDRSVHRDVRPLVHTLGVRAKTDASRTATVRLKPWRRQHRRRNVLTMALFAKTLVGDELHVDVSIGNERFVIA
jgi:hypothetical protein